MPSLNSMRSFKWRNDYLRDNFISVPMKVSADASLSPPSITFVHETTKCTYFDIFYLFIFNLGGLAATEVIKRVSRPNRPGSITRDYIILYKL